MMPILALVVARRRITFALAAALAASIGGAGTPPTAEAAFAGGNGKILFRGVEGPGFDWSIWSVDPDGTDRTQLTAFDDGLDSGGKWSPDGTKIVFQRRPDSDFVTDIWVMDADGSNEEELGPGFGPSWSADGTKILFTVSIEDTAYDLWTMDADGGNRERLTFTNDIVSGIWSPDGSRIAYMRGSGSMGTVKPDGTGHVFLRAGNFLGLDWSPDGRQLAFAQTTAAFHSELFTMPASGGAAVNVTSAYAGLPALLTMGAWSPDGTALLFAGRNRNSDGSFQPADMWTVSPKGTGGATQLTATPTFDEAPVDWQAAPPYPFGDIATSTFVNDIVWLAAEGITAGCTVHLFCPDAPVTREQMASFLVRAFDLPSTPTDYFTDDENSTHEADINALRAAGLTAGCGPGRYCPDRALTRAQAASFLARALELPSTGTDAFTDDEGNTHEADINRLAAAGITSGCTPTTFCPDQSVTRGQLAAFLRRAFDN